MIDLVRSKWPHAEISFLAREYTRELVEQHPEVARVLVADRNGITKPDLLDEVKGLSFDVAVHTYPRPQWAFLTWRAGIPVRVGTAFRWYSFLFNKRVRDHRRSGDLHEAIYNARLLAPLGIETPASVRPKLSPNKAQEEQARRVLAELGIDPRDRFAILHPGSGGSARDWSAQRFAELAKVLSASMPVVVTGAAHEAELIARVVEGSGDRVRACVGSLSLMGFAAFMRTATVFVSNSTGPIHIAAAVGTPVVGLYPPLAAARVGRWGPLGDRVATFTPDPAACPLCNGGPCQGNTCMEQIRANDVAEKIEKLVK